MIMTRLLNKNLRIWSAEGQGHTDIERAEKGEHCKAVLGAQVVHDTLEVLQTVSSESKYYGAYAVTTTHLSSRHLEKKPHCMKNVTEVLKIIYFFAFLHVAVELHARNSIDVPTWQYISVR